MRKDGDYLSPHEIFMKKDLMFTEQLQKVLNYSTTFEEEYDVTLFVFRIRYIFYYVKALQ